MLKMNKIDKNKIDGCIDLLTQLVESSESLADLTHDQRVALLAAAGKLSRPDKVEISKRNREIKLIKRKRMVEKDRQARAKTGIRSARQDVVFTAPQQITSLTAVQEEQELDSPRNCYVCKALFTKLHFFYDAMCPACADLNYRKRFQSAPLNGQIALITGSRLKIGYQAALMMLRAGATVIATTRFPVDSALRYSREEDFRLWANRLHIYGLDLRHTPSVELFTRFVEQKYSRLDLLINNAAQTVRRPSGFYAHLMENEQKTIEDLPQAVKPLLNHFAQCKDKMTAKTALSHLQSESALPVSWTGQVPGIGIRASAELSQVPYMYDDTQSNAKVFPKGELDADLQQVDLRKTNSWRLRIGEIETGEMLELQLINSIAPFVLCNRLVPLMKKDNTGMKHIVNVSAMEGKFHRFKKADRHPHTNMAKAALNMFTHTSASGLAKYGIYMNAVDTGWVTDEDPVELASFKQSVHDFQPPLDIVDGAARVCDPFFDGILTGKHWCGQFLKDYFPIDW